MTPTELREAKGWCLLPCGTKVQMGWITLDESHATVGITSPEYAISDLRPVKVEADVDRCPHITRLTRQLATAMELLDKAEIAMNFEDDECDAIAFVDEWYEARAQLRADVAANAKPMRIDNAPMYCPRCKRTSRVGDCEPDVDGDGSLGCPKCGGVVE